MAITRKLKPEPPEVNQDGDIMANVSETIIDGENTKELNYVAPLKDIKGNGESDNQEPENEFEDFEEFDEREVEEVPKTQIEKMFEELSIVSKGQSFIYYAMISRLPDNMSDDFRIRCNADMPAPLGKFQFNNRDILNFDSAIQKLNNNSGGRFNITIYDANGNPVLYKYQVYGQRQPESYRIGIINLYIPNPLFEIKTESNNNQNQNSITDREFYAEQQRKSDERLERLLTALNTKPEQSEIEKRVLNAAIDRMINPPQSEANPNIVVEALKHDVAQLRLIDRILPNNPASPEKPSWYEDFLASPQVKDGIMNIASNLFTGIQNVVETKALANLTSEQKEAIERQRTENWEEEDLPQPQPQPAQLSPEQIEEQNQKALTMQTVVNDIINEIESERPINAENKLVKKLIKEHKEYFNILTMMCKAQLFDAVLIQLANIAPDKIKEYIHPAFIQDGHILAAPDNTLIFAEGKERNKERLQELYNFLKG